MDMSVTYTNHRGESMTFGAKDGDLHYFLNELRSCSYSFDEYNGRARNFRKEGKTVLFKVGIAAKTDEEGLELREQLYRLCRSDVAAAKASRQVAGKPIRGRITICGYDLECLVVGQAPSEYEHGDRWLECELSVRVDDPTWRAGVTHPFRIVKNVEVGEFLDFPFDFPFDFTPLPKASEIENGSSQEEGSDFVMRIYGPCTNPYVQIGGNSYRVDVRVPSGGYLEVDSAAGTVEVVSKYGERTNAYDNRQRGAEGSGSYIFQRIPSGTSTVSWSNSFDFDVELFDERDIPPWK